MLFEALDPSHASGGSVTFEPGARTAWHSHPGGQILIVTAGTGRVQRWGDPIEEIRAGDVVRIPAGQKHWHGASPQASMTHIAITEHRDGTRVQWMEKVSDEQYNGVPPRRADVHRHRSPGARPRLSLRHRTAAGHQPTVGTASAEDRARTGDADRRRAVRRCVEAARVVAARPQPGDHLGPDRDRKAGAAWPATWAARSTTVYSRARPPACWRTWRSTAAGRAPSRRSRSTTRCTPRGRSTPAALRAVGPRLPAPASDAARARAVNDELGAVAPKFVQLTNDVVFDDLWRRSDLTSAGSEPGHHRRARRDG